VTTPLIIGHRGAPRRAPENTLAAVEAALAEGADGIEFDVHRTRDGAVVVHHDAVPRGAEPDDPGLRGRPFLDLTLAEVRHFRHADGSPIPTLDDLLAVVGDRATLYCELKGVGVVDVAAPRLASHRGPCAMHGFDHRAVLRAAALAPMVPRGILLDCRLVDTVQAMRAARATTCWPHVSQVDAALVRELDAIGAEVIVWTVNAPADARALASMGVRGLCTDVPRAIRDALPSTESPVSA
jgi:glycerophosphoryl diester phosphodiesterase